MTSEHTRMDDEWRVEVDLDEEGKGNSFGERLHTMKLDNEARKRIGGSVVVTRDGSRIFLYARHQQSAREAERVVRELLESEGLAAEVALTRWHPTEDDWLPADEPLPSTEAEAAEEGRRHERDAAIEDAESGSFSWEVVVHLPTRGAAVDYAQGIKGKGWPVKRRWRYVFIGTPTEEEAIGLGKELEPDVPEGSTVTVRGNPDDVPLPGFVWLGSHKPGAMRDLGL